MTVALMGGHYETLDRSLPNQREVTVKGLHHLQDDSPHEIGEALRAFIVGMRS